MTSRMVLIILGLGLVGVGGGVAWKLHPTPIPATTGTSSAVFATTSDNPDSSDVDTANNATVTVVYRPDLSAVVATIDVDIKTSQQDLTKYDYQHEIVLADGDINPLTIQAVTPMSVTSTELQLRMTAHKYPGNHFHVIVKDINGIHDRVLHLNTSL